MLLIMKEWPSRRCTLMPSIKVLTHPQQSTAPTSSFLASKIALHMLLAWVASLVLHLEELLATHSLVFCAIKVLQSRRACGGPFPHRYLADLLKQPAIGHGETCNKGKISSSPFPTS